MKCSSGRTCRPEPHGGSKTTSWLGSITLTRPAPRGRREELAILLRALHRELHQECIRRCARTHRQWQCGASRCRRRAADLAAAGIARDYKLRGFRSMGVAKGSHGAPQKYFGDLRALDITPDRIRAYQAHRRSEHVTPATVNRETSHLARAFRIAVKSGLLTVMPSGR